MKAIASTCLLAISIALAPTYAISRPDQSTPAPTLPNPPDAKPLPAPTEQETQEQKATPAPTPPAPGVWLGIVPTKVPDALVAQLELSGNPGILIKALGPNSPAKKAGLKEHDIVLNINDTVIRKGEDIANAISKSKPGEQAKIHILRGAKAQDITATLEAAPANLTKIDGIMGDSPEQGVQKLTHPFSGNAHQLSPLQQLQMMQGLSTLPDDWDADFAELEARMNSLLNAGQLGGPLGNPAQNQMHNMLQSMGNQGGATQMSSSSSFSSFNIATADGQVSIVSNNGKTNVTVTDSNGKLIYDGPYNTDEEKAAVPEAAKKQLEQISFSQ